MSGNGVKRFDLWKLSVLNMLSTPVRSGLTVLGFAIGVAAILAVLTLGEAGKVQIESEMGRLGIDKIWITPDATDYLPQGTGRWLENRLNITAEEVFYLPVRVESTTGVGQDATAIGCSWRYAQLLPLHEHDIREIQWETNKQITFVGEKLANELNIRTGDAVQIGSHTFEMCGTIKASDGFSNVPPDECVLIPFHTAAQWTGGNVHEIQLTSGENMSVENIQKIAEQMLRFQDINAQTMSMQVQMEAAKSVTDTFVKVLKWVALVCVLVGGIGIMNILLIGIRERKREIGVMKSLGTTSQQICILFLLEALVYALLGGLAGIGFGMILIHVAGTSIDLAASASMADCTVVFGSSMGIGVVFGVWPALRASRLKCVDALRQE